MAEFKIEEKLTCLEEKYPKSDEIKKHLVDLICKECQNDPQQRKTNVKAFMSRWDLYDGTIEKLVVWIKDLIETKLYMKSISVPDESDVFRLSDCWGAVYVKGDYAQEHTHESSFSFVYYVHVPDNSAPLVFTTSDTKIYPQEGDVIIFPGNVWHHVPRNESDGRVILAGNFIKI